MQATESAGEEGGGWRMTEEEEGEREVGGCRRRRGTKL